MKRAEVPTLRFPDFDDILKFIEAGKLFRNRKQKGTANLPLHSVTIDQGLIARKELDRNIISSTKPEQNLRALPQDLVYNMMRMWQGAIGYCETECMISPAYIVINPIPDIESKFYYYFFKSHRGLHLLKSQSYGLTEDRLRLYYKDFKKIQLANPPKREQQKIANFLSSIDQKIQQLRRKKELLEEYKKGVMQKLFSKETRFKDQNGDNFPDWETKRLGKLGAFTKGKGIAKKDIIEKGEHKCIRYGELYTVYNETIDEIHSRTNLPEDKLVFSKSNDVLIPSSGETHIDIATASCVLKDGIALGGDINIFRTNQNGVFISYYLKNAYKHQIASLAQGNSVIHLYSKQLKSLEILLPSIEEQIKIVDFLGKIDDKIQYIINKLSSTQNFKKGLLQQMFV